MKIDRLIGILSILLQQEKVTAPYLAEKFEVSRRTINRDIEDICKAGIPLVTTQGPNGGISIMEGYRIDRTVLTSSEMQSILTGLRSLDSVSGTNKYQQLMDKLAMGNSSILTSNSHILIDLSSWYKSCLAPKIELIQAAIGAREYITFAYFGPSGESRRKLEPYLLVFQWSSWYVWGYCTDREDYRLFKLNRMLELKALDERFEERKVPAYDMSPDKAFPPRISVPAVCVAVMKWRLIEESGLESFQEREDGKLIFSSCFSDPGSVFSWLLSMGDRVELVEPEELRVEFAAMAEKICRIYR
ncbi:MAG: helix-turn-helix transcriptional regulator [Hungatella sp.]